MTTSNTLKALLIAAVAAMPVAAFATETKAPAPNNAMTKSSTTGSLNAMQININTASESELAAVPHLGDANAKAIIAARPYASVEDLESKKVISKTVFNETKAHLAVK